jgi:uncharacterized protein (DUF2235 family)
MRRLIVCADGTWQSDEASGGRGVTNVVKMRDAIEPHPPSGVEQKVFYDKGVGVGNWWSRVMGGAFGDGLSQNVRDCYSFLVRTYRPGDQLYFFGFSRGAFTVRSLAGLVRKCGILPVDDAGQIKEAYEFYRKRGEEYHPAGPLATDFRKKRGSRETPIKCVGVWDTVGSLGVPTGGPIGMLTRNRYGFHDVRLSSVVENGFHALAIDERRKPFSPSLWHMREGDRHKDSHQRIEQRWFAGVHSNVGGGYAECGLSDVTLKWMMERAGECGLELKPGVLHALKCDCADRLHDSMSPWFRVFGIHERVIGAPQTDPDTGERLVTFEEVDDTVHERHAKPVTPLYAPRSFIRYWQGKPDRWKPHQPPAHVE